MQMQLLTVASDCRLNTSDTEGKYYSSHHLGQQRQLSRSVAQQICTRSAPVTQDVCSKHLRKYQWIQHACYFIGISDQALAATIMRPIIDCRELGPAGPVEHASRGRPAAPGYKLQGACH